MSLSAGSRLGPYEILSPLGAGGMGEVYRARDARLKRDVAIKVLPASFSADTDRLRRFEGEAQAAGALNHPNVLAIYDLGTHEGAPYIVSELLEGETLRGLLAGEPFPQRRATALASQIAAGLAAAHEKGIVHRDLKPENLFVTGDNRVKILDFGLAKLTQDTSGGEASSIATATAGTNPGTVMGTLGYMSPEQLRGRSVDHRTDLFSFGAILYEMLTGRRAFQGDSAADTISAILHKEPPEPSEVNQRITPALDRIVRHCLEKSPEARFQSARDISFALEALSDSAASGAVAAPRGNSRPRASWRLPALLALLIGALLGAGAMVLIGPSKRGESHRADYLTYSGSDHRPAISPDGTVAAFASDRDGRSRVWLKQLGGGEEVALTSGIDDLPRFSADGASIIFVRFEGGRPALYRVARLGGEPRKLMDNALEGDWAPDGARIAFVRLQSGSEAGQGRFELGVAAPDGTGLDVLYRSEVPLKLPRWSPDGKSIAVVRNNGYATGLADEVVIADLVSRKTRTLSIGERIGQSYGLSWNGDGRSLILALTTSAAAALGSRMVLRDARDGSVRELLRYPDHIGGAEVLADGRLLLESAQFRQSLRVFELRDDGAPVEGRWLTRGTSVDRQPIFGPDPAWVVFSSSRVGNMDIWGVSPAGAVRRFTDHPSEDFDPAVLGPDRRLLFSSSRSGNFEIWTAESDGRDLRQISRDGIDAENPTGTPDGRWIVYASGNPEKQGIWKIRSDGTEATRLSSDGGAQPEVSPDGAFVAYHTVSSGARILVIRLEDGKEAMPPWDIPLSGLAAASPISDSFVVGRLRWMPDGRAIAYLGFGTDGHPGIMVQDFVPGRDTDASRRRLLLLEDGQVPESFGFSADGRSLAVSVQERRSNLMTVDGVRGVRRQPARPR